MIKNETDTNGSLHLSFSLSLYFEPQMTFNKGIMDQIANLNSSSYQ